MEREALPRDAGLNELLTAGQQAFSTGDRQTAHELWRAAAVANPYDERVWVALLQVIQRNDDRIVCLQNIIAINPLNTDARRQLRALKHRMTEREEARHTAELEEAEETPPVRQRVPLRRAVVTGVEVGLVAVLLGIAFSIVVYGGILARLMP